MSDKVYYNVRKPGEDDIWHDSEECAGDWTAKVERSAVTLSTIDGNGVASPCKNCVEEAKD